MIRTGTKYRIASLAAVAVLVVSACSSSGSSPAASSAASAAPAASGGTAASQTINIGLEGPFTGDAAAAGQELKNATQMAFDAINWQVGSYKLNPVWIDDGTDPAKGTAAYEQAAVSQKIQAVFGGWNSSVAVALMDVAAKYQIPSFFSCGAANTVTDKWRSDPTKYGYWVAKCWPDPAKLVVAYEEWLKAGIADGSIKVPDKTFAVYGEDTDWGRSFGQALGSLLVADGWTKKSEDYFPLSTTDFTSLVSRWNADKDSLIVGTTTSGSVYAALLKALQDSGNKSIVIADGMGQDAQFYKNIGSASDYVIDSTPSWSKTNGQQFIDAYKAKYGVAPSAQAAGLAYDYANFFIKVLQSTLTDQGSLTSATIYKEAQDKLWTGQLTYTSGAVMSSYDYSKDSIPNPVVGAGHFIFPVIQWVQGKATVIFPTDSSTGAYQPHP